MTSLPNFQWLAALVLDRMLICLMEGVLLAGAVTLLLRLLPRKNSQTRFAVWLAALLAILILPLLRGEFRPNGPASMPSSMQRYALVTISSAWAVYLVGAWAAIAAAGLIRVAAGVWQLRRLRRNCRQLSPELLGPELREAIEKLRRTRQVSILVSEQVEVPGAIGFFRPAILLPPWILEDLAATELKYVLLHELAHLERWDDWSNLAQKVVKALLFFHPGVWWIERKLSLDREMACDDAVVARAESAHVYAECLATVAEKSFLRRQCALVQAAVDRVHQLSLRLASILDRDRPQTSFLWKPALPMVAVFAVLCAFSASWTPELVRLSGPAPIAASKASTPISAPAEVTRAAGQPSPAATESVSQQAVNQRTAAQRTSATLPSRAGQLKVIPALYTPTQTWQPAMKLRNKPPSHFHRARRAGLAPKLTAASDPIHEAPTANGQPDASGMVVVVMTNQIVVRETGRSGLDVLQVHVLQLRWIVPANPRPKLIPRKT